MTNLVTGDGDFVTWGILLCFGMSNVNILLFTGVEEMICQLEALGILGLDVQHVSHCKQKYVILLLQ